MSTADFSISASSLVSKGDGSVMVEYDDDMVKDDDTFKEPIPEPVAARELRLVVCTRWLVVLVLTGAAIAVGLLTYQSVVDEQQEQEEQDVSEWNGIWREKKKRGPFNIVPALDDDVLTLRSYCFIFFIHLVL